MCSETSPYIVCPHIHITVPSLYMEIRGQGAIVREVMGTFLSRPSAIPVSQTSPVHERLVIDVPV